MSQLIFNQAFVNATNDPLTRYLRTLFREEGITDEIVAARYGVYAQAMGFTEYQSTAGRNNLRKMLSGDAVTIRMFYHVIRIILGLEVETISVTFAIPTTRIGEVKPAANRRSDDPTVEESFLWDSQVSAGQTALNLVDWTAEYRASSKG